MRYEIVTVAGGRWIIEPDLAVTFRDQNGAKVAGIEDLARALSPDDLDMVRDMLLDWVQDVSSDLNDA